MNILYILLSTLLFNQVSATTLIDFNKEILSQDSISEINSFIEKYSINIQENRALFTDSSDNFENSIVIIDKDGKEHLMSGSSRGVASDVIKTRKTLRYLMRKSKSAKKLISKLNTSSFKTYIRPSRNLAGSYVSIYGDRCNIGNGGALVYLDSQKIITNYYKHCRVTGIGTSSRINWKVNTHKKMKLLAINLAHELYHSYDLIRGVLDHRVVQNPELEFVELREYRAVFFENLVRKDLKENLRLKYSKSSKQNMFLNNQHFWY